MKRLLLSCIISIVYCNVQAQISTGLNTPIFNNNKTTVRIQLQYPGLKAWKNPLSKQFMVQQQQSFDRCFQSGTIGLMPGITRLPGRSNGIAIYPYPAYEHTKKDVRVGVDYIESTPYETWLKSVQRY